MKEICVNCKYYDNVDEKTKLLGECRRHPPQVVESMILKRHKSDNLYDSIYYATHHPIVRMNSMCGEWKA